MKILKLILIVPAMLFAVICIAQPICAFDNLHRKLLKENPAYRKSILAGEAHIREYIQKHPAGLSPALRGSSINNTLYTIPVVVHVIHTGGAVGTIYNPATSQIMGAINYLNQVYNGTYPGIQGVGDLQVQFVLASKDTNCNASAGIDRIDGSSLANYVTNGVNASTSGGVSDLALKNFDRWDPSVFYNIWVVNKIDGKDGTSGQFIAGFAYFAGAPSFLDGTIMLATQMVSGQKTLPHEIGHALSLYHPFEGSNRVDSCPPNANCNTDGDLVCDTDPISENISSGVVDFTCRTGINTCTGTAYSINTEHNFMNYTSCYTLFTAGQKARMQAAMTLPSRASLISSYALGGTYPAASFTPSIAPSCKPATSATGLSADYAGIMGITVANKSFSSDAAATDNGYIDRTAKCEFLIGMQRGNTYNFSATLLAANREQLRVWIDYNNDGIFNDVTELIYYNPDIANPGGGNYANVSGSFTIPASAVVNNTLRMRVMDEVSTAYGSGFTITGPCYNPSYGQAEDYPVYLSLYALPVKMDYFNGIKKGNDAVLSWQTSFEENAKEFQVEKSTDGVAFNAIGTVPATDNSSGSVYSYTDKNISNGINYYRLRQVDKDQTAELSPVVIVKSSDNTAAKLNVINNPFAEQLDIVFNGITAGNSNISLFDITGRKIFSRNYAIADGRVEHIDVSGAGLKPGVYIIRAQVADRIMTAKVIKQ